MEFFLIRRQYKRQHKNVVSNKYKLSNQEAPDFECTIVGSIFPSYIFMLHSVNLPLKLPPKQLFQLIGFHHTWEWHNPTSHQPLAGTVALQ